MPKTTRAKVPQSDDLRCRLTDAQLRATDKAVGSQVRFRRISLGYSQQEVSEIMGLTFQQLQKYEHGTNRISGSRLRQLSQILHVPISFFFENVDAQLGIAEDTSNLIDPSLPPGVMSKKKTIDLINAFYAIKNAHEREAAFKLIASLGAAHKSAS